MKDAAHSLHALAEGLRRSPGFAGLSPRERIALDENLRRLQSALQPPRAGALETTPRSLFDPEPVGATPPPQRESEPPREPAPAPPPPPPATATIGSRAADAMEAVDFTGFVAGLVTGTFQAIVDATAQQIREYAQLVASLARTVDDFARENVGEAQVRDWLASRHPQDLAVALPAAGTQGTTRLRPRPGREDTSPDWLADYGLAGEQLDEELTEGALLRAGRPRVAEERMQALSTMVLMGIQRVVIQDGNIRARMQFHASARDRTNAEAQAYLVGQQVGIAGRQVQLQSATTTMVSTARANAQSDASIKADLMGEVNIVFRSETFPLERFADGAAIQLLNRHARWSGAPAGERQGRDANGAAGGRNGDAGANGRGAPAAGAVPAGEDVPAAGTAPGGAP